MFRHFPDF